MEFVKASPMMTWIHHNSNAILDSNFPTSLSRPDLNLSSSASGWPCLKFLNPTHSQRSLIQLRRDFSRWIWYCQLSVVLSTSSWVGADFFGPNRIFDDIQTGSKCHCYTPRQSEPRSLPTSRIRMNRLPRIEPKRFYTSHRYGPSSKYCLSARSSWSQSN